MKGRALGVLAIVLAVAAVVIVFYLGSRIALCEDGAITFSRGEQGACSGHGGLIR
jgi:hypothetical protein